MPEHSGKRLRLSRLYQVHEFAALTGITAKALHHYDRLGLLKPRRTAAGYRLYSERDLECLEQIVALKFLGLPLKQIRGLLERDTPLSEVLAAQRTVLEEKRRLLDRAIGALLEAERVGASGNSPDAAILRRLIEVIQMQSHLETMKQYYSEDSWSKLTQLRRQYTEETRRGISEAWRELFREAESLLCEDPAGEKAQEFAARWIKLWERTTGGDAGVQTGLRNAWADRHNWPPELQRFAAEFNTEKVGDFITRIFACWMKKYFTEQAWERKKVLDRPDTNQAWKELFREARALLGEDPAGERAQQLAERWCQLSESSTGGDREIQSGMKNAWKDRRNWPLTMQQHTEDSKLPEIAEWIGKAICKRRGLKRR